jgi:capsular exopolysaccharide synthesis family protein
VVARRWPLIAVGLAFGAVLGVIIHIFSTPLYQSLAQVLVVKKRVEVGAGDARVGVLEDYVATQVTLIKSEKIRREAVKDLRQAKLNQPLQGDDLAAAEMIRIGLNVVRDKDSSSPNQIGSGIVNMTFKGRDVQDARRILEAVINAYKRELTNLYERSTTEKLQTLDKAIGLIDKQNAAALADKVKAQEELRRITTEEVPSIRIRLSAEKTKQGELLMDKMVVDEQISLIEKTPKNRRDRLAVLAYLTAQSRPGGVIGVDREGPEARLRQVQAQYASMAKTLGNDHERMIAMRSEIEFLKGEIAAQNPEDPTGMLDELGAYGGNLKQRKNTIELQLKELERRLSDDEKNLQDAGGVQDKIDNATVAMKTADQKIAGLIQEKAATMATQGLGGYEANEITPPGDGIQVAPVLIQSILMGLAVGLVLGALAVLATELTDKSFKSPAEIRRRLGLPVVGHIPQIRVEVPADANVPAGLDPVLASALRPKSAEAEAYRGLRTQLYFSTQGRGHQVVQVTSPNPGDGKTTLAANLAVSIAQSGKRVALVDCDFRKPRIHKMFDLSTSEVGLAGVIAGEAPLPAAVRPSGLPNLDLLPCGPRPANPAELLTSPQFQEMLTELRRTYDFVIVDTPPLLAVSDPAVVAPRVDGVLLVFRMTKKVRPAAERAREQLAALGANVLGVVVNGWSSGGRGYYEYNYGASYGYRYTDYEYADDYADEPSYHGGERAPLPAKG